MIAKPPGVSAESPVLSCALARTLDTIDGFLPDSLIDERARRNVAVLSEWLPAGITRRMYLECRLDASSPRVDLVFCVDEASRTLMMPPYDAWQQEGVRTHPMWSGLTRGCQAWATAGSQIGNNVHDLWLEFDTDDRIAAAAVPVPSMFVGLAPHVARSPLTCWTPILEPVEMIRGGRVPSGIAAAARRCLELLPPAVTLPYVGLMYPRDPVALRLCISPICGPDLLRYLRTLDWAGSVDELEQVLTGIRFEDDTSSLDLTTMLHLDVREHVLPRVGLEIKLLQRPQLHGRLVEQRWLDRLCERLLCASSKRSGLLRWPGCSVERFDHECWPSLVVRRVSHLKIVHTPGDRPELKAYLSLFHGLAGRRSPGPRVPTPFEGPAAEIHSPSAA